jgi:7,8-dihydroneopterin aldolase/epimerase/oxygenase
MALRAKWSLRVDDLSTRLAFGDAADGGQTVRVSLLIEGLVQDEPGRREDCFDAAPICDWITGVWPKSPATPLIETRVNQLLLFLFAHDKRVQNAWVGLYRTGVAPGAARVGIERQASRSQFQTRLRAALP